MATIIKVEGIGESCAQTLAEAGASTRQVLLARGVFPQGRKEIAEKTGISDALISRWVNHSELLRNSPRLVI